MTTKKIKVDYRRDVYVYHTVLENQDLEYWESKIDLEKKNNPKGTTDHESFSSVWPGVLIHTCTIRIKITTL